MKMSIIDSLLQTVKCCYPELRTCQILTIAAHYGGWNGNDLFYCPDDIIEAGLKFMLK